MAIGDHLGGRQVGQEDSQHLPGLLIVFNMRADMPHIEDYIG